MSFKTDDLFLAAFLVTDGHTQFEGITDNGSGRKAILLNPEPPLQAIKKFYGGEAKLSALAFSETYKRLLTSLRNTPLTL